SWPVYDLSTDVHRCVRYDQHAVYLGAPGPSPDCPARVIGRTETIHVQPLSAATQASEALATQTTTINGVTVRLDPNGDTTGAITAVVPSRSVLVTITFGADRATANAILQGMHAV